jgi:hypothetical protein
MLGVGKMSFMVGFQGRKEIFVGFEGEIGGKRY